MSKVYDPILCMVVDKPATRTTDAANLKGLKDDYGRLRNASSIIGNIDSLSSSTKSAILKAIESGMREIDTRTDRAYMK